MVNKVLVDHYDRKYSQEIGPNLIETIRKKRIPTDRFEAAINFIPKFFKEGDILELGAGNGIVARTLLNLDINIESYAATEISLSRLKNLRGNLKDNRLRIFEMDAENIPRQEHGKYDAVIMISLIEHLIDPIRSMKNVKDLLKPGGFVYIDTANIAKYTRRVKLLFGTFPSTASNNQGLSTFSGKPVDLYDEGHFHYFTYRSLSSMLIERCGFNRITKLGYPGGRTVFGKSIHNLLAMKWPELFSELVIIAYAL